jgi:phosphoribosyl 1,2-cyclic phosphodiesterase
MEITFWGTRGSVASPGPDTVIFGGNTTCVEITLSSGHTVIIDAGTGIRALGDRLENRGERVDIHLLMTHVHLDHVIGFPFFAPLFDKNTRIVVDGFHKGIEGLRRVFSRDYLDGTWPVLFDDLQADIEVNNQLSRGKLTIDDTVVESHILQHPQGGLGYRFTEESGSFVFLTDNELQIDGKGISFSEFVTFCKGADMLVHDCQYVPEEMAVRHGWGHSDTETVVNLALEAGVKHLLLFHHDPWRKDREIMAMVDNCSKAIEQAGASIFVEAAREGVTLRI